MAMNNNDLLSTNLPRNEIKMRSCNSLSIMYMKYERGSSITKSTENK
jgi:hypothetical protein